MRRSRALVMLAMLAPMAGVAADISYPATIKVAKQELKLGGVGVLSRWMIKGCKMALYVPDGVEKADILKDNIRCLEFYYYRKIKAGQFATAAWDTLKKNWSQEELAVETKNINTLHAIYQDVSKGDRYRLLYVPGEGTTLFLNGRKLGTIKGANFSKVYFSVWLGKTPIDKKLKKKLTSKLK